jgi:hypothetical protein
MSLRHTLRNFLLTFGYLHIAALAVLPRGSGATKKYLSEIYRCSKTDAGLHLPTITLEELTALPSEFRVMRPNNWGGSMTITEISSLCHLIAARKPNKILEIGTFKGLTTLNMAINAPSAEVHSLDLPLDAKASMTQFDTKDSAIISNRGKYFYESKPESTRIYQHYGDSANFDFSKIGQGVDFCLVDAAHSYEYVKNDTIKVLPLMTDDSFLLWHDYGRNDFLASSEDVWGVSKFLHEISFIGVRIIQGTSLGILPINQEIKQKLIKHLSS